MGAMKRAKIEPAAAGSFYRQEIRVVDSPATRRAASLNMKKRPARLVLPEQQPSTAEFSEMGRGKAGKEEESMFQARGRDYCLASKRGRRDIMEDGYGVTLDISGDPKQVRKFHTLHPSKNTVFISFHSPVTGMEMQSAQAKCIITGRKIESTNHRFRTISRCSRNELRIDGPLQVELP